MSTPKSQFEREAIREVLMFRAGKPFNSIVVAEATLNIWQQMATRLIPVIGERGVEVLFSRSLHLTTRTFPRLEIAADHGDKAALIANVKAQLASSGSNDAIEASCALLGTFTELLSTLIGASLTERLLGPVWTLPSPISVQESES